MISQHHRSQLISVAMALAVAVFIGLVVALTFDAASQYGYTRSEGVAESLPLALLAFFNAFTWMPILMPFLLPIVAVLVLLVAAFVYPARYVRRRLDEEPAPRRKRHHFVWRQRHA